MDNNMEDTQHVQCWTCNHVLDFASYYIITLIWTYYHGNHDHILWNPLWCMLHQCSSKFSSSWGIITDNFFLLHISANTHGLPDVRCFLLNEEVRSWTIRFCEFFRGTELCPHITYAGASKNTSWKMQKSYSSGSHWVTPCSFLSWTHQWLRWTLPTHQLQINERCSIMISVLPWVILLYILSKKCLWR